MFACVCVLVCVRSCVCACVCALVCVCGRTPDIHISVRFSQMFSFHRQTKQTDMPFVSSNCLPITFCTVQQPSMVYVNDSGGTCVYSQEPSRMVSVIGSLFKSECSHQNVWSVQNDTYV